MKAQQRRRKLRRSNGKNVVPFIAWRVLLATFAMVLLMWIGAALRFLLSDGGDGLSDTSAQGRKQLQSERSDSEHRHIVAFDGGDGLGDASVQEVRKQHQNEGSDLEHRHIVALDVQVEPRKTITIRISVLPDDCPKAYEFITWIIDHQEAECRPCTIYRGEPVPSYWGSEDYPDRWDNGGRWGPPYALVQGGFVNGRIDHVEREGHRPMVKRGTVAWAGTRGIHFFVALADHPEWKHEHTVWGHVLEEDMPAVDALVRERPLKVLEHNVPVVTNFVDPMPFTIRTVVDR